MEKQDFKYEWTPCLNITITITHQINKLCGFIQLASVAFTTKKHEKTVDAACVLKDWDQEFTPQSLTLIPYLITHRSSRRLGPPAKAALLRAL